MANLCEEFDIFHNRIALSDTTKTVLGFIQDEIRDRIRNFFRSSLDAQVPKFRSQGAISIDTSINPLSGEHHIEDGVYLQHLDKQDSSNWPSAETVRQRVAEAVKDLQPLAQVVGPSCVRVQKPGQYCVDLHCYADLNGSCMQAVGGDAGWTACNPLSIAGWFGSYINLHGEQLRRIVRYLMAWADYQSGQRGKMPDDLVLTVLATYNFNPDSRDDLALAKTLEAIASYVRATVFVLNPVNIAEELSARLTGAQKMRFREAVDNAASLANAAVLFEDAHRASKLWRKQFGSRFPLIQQFD